MDDKNIYQFRTDRNPKTRLFRFKAGTLVNFAMDLEEVYMTTKLDGQATFFLPFNMGKGHGVTAGAGNPAFKDKYSVSYMWEDILTKDTILDLISKFIFVEVKEKVDEETGKVKRSENLIFPRYHQLDVIRKILADVRENGTAQNYLIQHSAGSGKTNSIAWLAHRLTSLHDANNKIIFDNVVIVTDRVVVDRQLQKAIMGMEHKAGLIRVMDDKCVSADLAIALNGNTKIIATTIQKFPYIVDSVANLKNKRFAVIIDEAHSSTAGKDMAAITMTLGSGEDTEADVEDMISSEIKRNGKQANVSMFAFTATPKPTTIQLFGHQNTKGQKEAFHVYSMKQAIEEGFILDVLQNYTEYSTFYQINKEIEDDPRCKTNDAKRQIARFIELHDTNIAQRVEVIVEHFRTTVMQELGGQAKAMVITASRQSAVKYRQAFEDYIAKKGYEGIHALVAFSGKVKLPDDEQEYTESSLNGFPEDRLTKEFDTDKYQVLLVANKYQTGFDQPKLCAMYVLKKLKGVNAVQTLSRLNRICAPYDKKTFVLDFVNSYEDIKSAFAPYYTTTLLANSVTPSAVYDLEAKIDAYGILDPADIEAANDILYADKVNGKQKQRLTFFLQKSKKLIEHYEYNTQRQCVADMRSFVRFYEFLLQVSSFEDTDLHKKYNFVSYLLAYINIKHPGGGFNLDGKIMYQIFTYTKKVSINLLSDKNVESYEVNGDTILVIYVPRAKREQKPVYINNDLFGGCYRRDWEGDYHCSKAEIKGMLRDAADETEDMKIVEQFDISAIDTESLKGFRNHHKSYRPEHVFNNLPDDEYLERIGAAGFGEDGKLHPTTAGLLMFGEEYHIVREFPEYFLDYREMLDPTIRWTDRLQSSSGDWSGNVFDFFFRVNSKIAKDIKKPFKLEGITRVDDTPVHKAVREALVNCLVNTDYFLPCGVVIKKEDDKLVIENPGSIRTGKKQMLRGGISDPRNKTLMKMFNMIGIGERAGSGIPDIYQVWENEGWPMPVVEESYNPDRTRLSLEFAKKQTIKTSEEEKEPKRSQKGAEKEPIKGAERKKEILKLIKVNSTITQVEIMKELDLTRKQVQKDMKELQEMHIIAREGTNRRGRWIIVKENK